MLKAFGLAFFVLIFMAFFVRRFFGKERPRRLGLHDYLRSHEETARHKIKSMRNETRRFDALEALGPVEAGLKEILEVHENPDGFSLKRQGDTLILLMPQKRLEITWELSHTIINVQGKSRNIHGNGHWKATEGGKVSEIFFELSTLMGYLSALVRDGVKMADKLAS